MCVLDKYDCAQMNMDTNSLSEIWERPNLGSITLKCNLLHGPRQAILVLIANASSDPRSLARTFAARSYKQ